MWLRNMLFDAKNFPQLLINRDLKQNRLLTLATKNWYPNSLHGESLNEDFPRLSIFILLNSLLLFYWRLIIIK